MKQYSIREGLQQFSVLMEEKSLYGNKQVIATFTHYEDAEFFLAHKRHEAMRNAKWLAEIERTKTTPLQ